MELWQAILLGSELRGQAFGDYVVDQKSCALEAAREATGSENIDELVSRYRAQMSLRMPCPACGLTIDPRTYNREPFNVFGIISHLNDGHRWTRERIALEFVKPLEESLKPAPVEVEMKEVKC